MALNRAAAANLKTIATVRYKKADLSLARRQRGVHGEKPCFSYVRVGDASVRAVLLRREPQ